MATESHDCVGEGIVGFVVFVARYLVVQDVPQPCYLAFDWVQEGAVGWQKVQNNAPPAECKPFLDGGAVMVAGIIEKDVDFAFIFEDGLQIFEQLNG